MKQELIEQASNVGISFVMAVDGANLNSDECEALYDIYITELDNALDDVLAERGWT